MKNALRLSYIYPDLKIGMKMVFVVAMESAINVQLWGWNPHVLASVAGPTVILRVVNVLPPKNQTSNVQIRKLTRFVLEEVMLIILDSNAYQELTQFETTISQFFMIMPLLCLLFICTLVITLFFCLLEGRLFYDS